MKKLDAKKWQDIYDGWMKSGQNQAQYCEHIGIEFKHFKNTIGYLKKTKRVNRVIETNRKKRVLDPSSFAPVQVIDIEEERLDEQTQAYCEIKFKGSGSIQIETESGFKKLRGLLMGSECLVSE
jgi:hypothetical protein